MPINKIEQNYIKNQKYGLIMLQQKDFLQQLKDIDHAFVIALKEGNYEKVTDQLDEICYLFALIEDEKQTLVALEIYYTSVVIMLLRYMLKNGTLTEIHLSNAVSLISIIKQWHCIKDYLYFTPWFVKKLKELLYNTTPINVNSYVYQAILIIKQELQNPNLSNAYIANKLGISNSYLCYLFKHDYNEHLTTIINKLRLKQALTDIKNTNLSISEITKKYGYKSHSYFSKIFKQCYGMSPLQYRKRQYLKY